MTDVRARSAGTGSLHRLDYLYDKAHNRRMEKNTYDAAWVSTLPAAAQAMLGARNTKGDVYRYDWAHRLVDARYDVTNPVTEVQNPGSQPYARLVTYALDGLGNRSQVQTTVPPGTPVTVTYATDVVNQYTSVGGANRAHDANGNVKDDGTLLFAFDYLNHLTEVRLKATNALVVTYRYDALGRRVEKSVSGAATTRFVYDGQDVVEEYDGADVWQASYTFEDAIDTPRTMDRADLSDVDGDANTTEVLRFVYHQNALGSVTEVSAPGGAVVEWVTYDVYGKATIFDKQGAVVAQSAVGNRVLFTGRELDPETGLYHYRARAYDPATGRFVQRDPAGYVDGLSLYEYARSRSASDRDPSGMSPDFLSVDITYHGDIDVSNQVDGGFGASLWSVAVTVANFTSQIVMIEYWVLEYSHFFEIDECGNLSEWSVHTLVQYFEFYEADEAGYLHRLDLDPSTNGWVPSSGQERGQEDLRDILVAEGVFKQDESGNYHLSLGFVGDLAEFVVRLGSASATAKWGPAVFAALGAVDSLFGTDLGRSAMATADTLVGVDGFSSTVTALRGLTNLKPRGLVLQVSSKATRAARGVHRAGDLPARGKPSSTDVVDRGGGKGTIRDYGPDGKAKVDYDFGHDHGFGDPHAHDWNWSEPRHRQPGRRLRPGE